MTYVDVWFAIGVLVSIFRYFAGLFLFDGCKMPGNSSDTGIGLTGAGGQAGFAIGVLITKQITVHRPVR